MVRFAWFVVAAVLAASPVVNGGQQPQPSQQSEQLTPPDTSSDSQRDADEPNAAQKSQPLQEESRMQILRSIDGEFARLLTSLPGGKKGFHVRAGEPIDPSALRKAIQKSGAALNTGDSVQITRLEFQERDILIDLDGGGRKQGGSWKDRVQLQVGLPAPVQTGSTTSNPNGPVTTTARKTGVTLFVDFDRTLPDMSPDQVKHFLRAVLDFSKQRSAAVQWTETLPPSIQAAIADKRPEVGMDREEVLAAIGRPERKVREREADGSESEDWIYGRPPAKTIFVRFTGEKVTTIDSYPN